MAISTNSGDSSPRISFSHDLEEGNPTQTCPKQVQVIRSDQSLVSENCPSGSDFNFCVTCSDAERETCPADELFFNGVIIPTQMREKINIVTSEEINAMTKATLVREEKITGRSNSRSFWRFRRSSSLNCEKQRSSIWSNLPLLLRSKSTGSSSIWNKIHSANQPKKQNRNNSTKMSDKLPPQYQKPSGKTKYARNYSSVLNVPPPYIAKGTSDLLDTNYRVVLSL
ncbi:hypothetical protein Cgig2_005663 [Carnegiea gigantea]|uniref:Uncharacterized protein n=1 Tax=Carnegiea gigantea TaxID=171969 RepID=A0A9Q1QQ63_9CARY|nr:hypothetical protein Cgig2_005663 [Carnegiea gigantea]